MVKGEEELLHLHATLYFVLHFSLLVEFDINVYPCTAFWWLLELLGKFVFTQITLEVRIVVLNLVLLSIFLLKFICLLLCFLVFRGLELFFLHLLLFLKITLKERGVVIEFRKNVFATVGFRLDMEIAFKPKAFSPDFDQICPTLLLDIVYQSIIEQTVISQTLFYLLNNVISEPFLTIFLQNIP